MKEVVVLWKGFIEEWIPKHKEIRDDGEYYLKPNFYDFMQWLVLKIDK